MKEGVLIYRATSLCEFTGPVDKREPTPVAFQRIDAGTTGTCRLHNTANDALTVDLVARIASNAAASATTLTVDDNDGLGFADGDKVEVELDSGLKHATTVTTGGSTSTVVLTAGIATAASANKYIRRVRMGTVGGYIAVDNLGAWKIDDELILIMDSYVRWKATVDQVIAGLRCKLIRIDTAPSSDVGSGQEVKIQVGADIGMLDFGTFPSSSPVVGDPEWGYRALIAEDHGGLSPGMHVRAEMEADDGAGVIARRNEWATVKLRA